MLLQSGVVNSLQSGTIIITQRGMYYKKGCFITKWDRYYKLEQLLQKMPVHLRDTRVNGNPSLLAGQMQLDNGVLYDIMPFG